MPSPDSPLIPVTSMFAIVLPLDDHKLHLSYWKLCSKEHPTPFRLVVK